MNAATRTACENKLEKIMAKWGDITPERKVSKLDILALKAYAASPWQIVIAEKRIECNRMREIKA